MIDKLAKEYWWKITCVVLLYYVVITGFLSPVPIRYVLHETIRNLYFHVPMWFTMIVLFAFSFSYAIKYLSNGKLENDFKSVEGINAGILFGALGISTGMIWGKYTWGDFWPNDPKLNATAIALLMYLAYFVLRSSIDDYEKRAKLSAIYNIFSFSIMLPLIFVLPRLTDSLHPGNGGNPAFSQYDLDNSMRVVFYPACIGWILLGIWIYSLRIRFRLLKDKNITI